MHTEQARGRANSIWKRDSLKEEEKNLSSRSPTSLSISHFFLCADGRLSFSSGPRKERKNFSPSLSPRHSFQMWETRGSGVRDEKGVESGNNRPSRVHSLLFACLCFLLSSSSFIQRKEAPPFLYFPPHPSLHPFPEWVCVHYYYYTVNILMMPFRILPCPAPTGTLAAYKGAPLGLDESLLFLPHKEGHLLDSVSFSLLSVDVLPPPHSVSSN